jgi:hypothetical protein
MDTESDLFVGDKLTAFCEECTARNAGAWPISERNLAMEFIKHFNIPPIVLITHLMGLCAALNIELVRDELPPDLLGLNASIGYKRVIVYSGRSGDLILREHTILHEIREIIESILRKLDFPTVEPSEMEFHANAFASEVMAIGTQDEFGYWYEYAAEIESTWWRIGALLLIGACSAFVLARVVYCANQTPSQGALSTNPVRQRYVT